MGFYVVGFSCVTSEDTDFFKQLLLKSDHAKGLEPEIEEWAPIMAVAPSDVAHVFLELATMFPHSLALAINGMCFNGCRLTGGTSPGM